METRQLGSSHSFVFDSVKFPTGGLGLTPILIVWKLCIFLSF